MALLLAATAGCSLLGRSREPAEDANASSPVIDPRAAFIVGEANDPILFLILVTLLLLIVGCFLEPIASISILVPVLMPIILKVGIHPVHFGVVMTLNLMIGLLHPPLGMVLFVLSRIAKLSIERTTMAILPWLIPLMMSLIAITMIPELTLWLPRTMGMLK